MNGGANFNPKVIKQNITTDNYLPSINNYCSKCRY